MQSASSDVLPATTPGVISDNGAVVTFSKNDADTLPGQSCDLLVTFQRPVNSAADVARFPLYSGFVSITGKKTDGSVIPSETYTVPYNGLNARMFDMPGTGQLSRNERDVELTCTRPQSSILLELSLVLNSLSWPLEKTSMLVQPHTSEMAASPYTSASSVSCFRYVIHLITTDPY